MNTSPNKITLNLDGDAEVNIKAFIAPIEHTAGNFHKKWDALANLQAAEPEKQYAAAVFGDFLPSEAVSVGECWEIKQTGVPKLLEQLHLPMRRMFRPVERRKLRILSTEVKFLSS